MNSFIISATTSSTTTTTKNNIPVINFSYFFIIWQQMAFVLTFLQELIQGKGVVQGITEGDPVNLAALGAFAVTVVGLTAWLAIQGDDDYVARDMKNKKI